MSRCYEMHATVTGYDRARYEQIIAALEEAWAFDSDSTEFNDEPGEVIFFSGTGNLCAGITEKQFTESLTYAVWEANGKFCAVEVNAIYLDALPDNTHELDEKAYQKWKEGRT